MALIGKNGAVYSGANAIAEIKDFSIEQSSNIVATTVMGTDWVGNKATQNSWTCSFNAFYDPTDTNGQKTLTVGSSVTIKVYPEGNTSTKEEITGTCIIDSVTISGSADGLVEASFSVTGDGALTFGTVV